MGAQWKQKFRELAGASKGALFTRLSKEIIVAAKSGDPNPEANSRLRAALENARKNSMPRDTIERALKKGRGEGADDAVYETVLYEGFCPHQVPIIVECLTDNRARTAGNLRVLFRKGQLGASGSVQWLFERRGIVEATHPEGMDPEEAAIEAGAQDVSSSDDGVEFVCDAPDLAGVAEALNAMGWVTSSASLAWIPKSRVALEDAARAKVEAFVAEFEDDDDVQKIYVAL
jgi:YebC/PmpR family DNA-binding regulatory protein